ncbi:hypothetical protein [Comamonas aquatilis]|uniref:hypothetical protein n=1 Tax=Comamonas aquatilis TaxID=1778406 RepID=UPI0039EE37CD
MIFKGRLKALDWAQAMRGIACDASAVAIKVRRRIIAKVLSFQADLAKPEDF